MKNSTEILNACKELEIKARILSKEDSRNIITETIRKYNVNKITGHLSIHNNSYTLPIEDYEFTYSLNLNEEPVYMFFDQNNINKNDVVLINDGRKVCKIMENTYGMEYFLSNIELDFLITVNWYVLEGSGSVIDWIKGYGGVKSQD